MDVKTTLTKVKTGLGIAWVWIKEFWSYAVLVILAGLTLWFYRDRQTRVDNLLNERQATSIRHRQEIAELQRIRDEEIRKREQIEEQYRETISRINKEHQEALDRLSSKKKAEIRRIIEETVDDPDAMASRINNLFGIPIYRQ